MWVGGGTMARAGAALLLLALAGCADQRVAAAEASGREAMNAGHPQAAARAYRAALARAETDGNGAAIARTGTELAIAELNENRLGQTLADARNLQAELARRHRKPPPALDLVVATALYRQGNLAQAAVVARQVAAGHHHAVALRGRFLMGLIAAEQQDSAGVLAASLVLSAHHDPYSVADATELDARLALARGDARAARSRALAAVKQRLELADGRGVARCEALAADAALALNAREEAAQLYLRAGRGEMAVGENARARTWLGKARSLATEARTKQEALAALADIGG